MWIIAVTGLLDEAAALRARYGEMLRSYSAMGYREAFALLDGRCDRDTAIADDTTRTIRYARRQDTWFRSEPGITWLPPGTDAEAAAIRLTDDWLAQAAG